VWPPAIATARRPWRTTSPTFITLPDATMSSMAHLKRAVAIFSKVGADEATRLPEIWKLVSW
jgi:hypothetical protein